MSTRCNCGRMNCQDYPHPHAENVVVVEHAMSEQERERAYSELGFEVVEGREYLRAAIDSAERDETVSPMRITGPLRRVLVQADRLADRLEGDE